MAGQECSLRINLQAGANFSAALSEVTIRVEYGTGTDENPVSGFTGTADALSTTQALTTSATDYIYDGISIPSSATQVAVWVQWSPVGTAGANDSVTVNAAQLTVDSAAGFERLNQAQILADCQRYYQAGDVWWGGYALNSVGCGYHFPLPVALRATPTVALTNTSNTAFPATPGTSITSSIVSAYRVANGTGAGAYSDNYTADAEIY
jgi:hypothetical protein